MTDVILVTQTMDISASLEENGKGLELVQVSAGDDSHGALGQEEYGDLQMHMQTSTPQKQGLEASEQASDA